MKTLKQKNLENQFMNFKKESIQIEIPNELAKEVDKYISEHSKEELISTPEFIIEAIKTRLRKK